MLYIFIKDFAALWNHWILGATHHSNTFMEILDKVDYCKQIQIFLKLTQIYQHIASGKSLRISSLVLQRLLHEKHFPLQIAENF